MKQPKEGSHLLGTIQDLDNGGTGGGGYIADDSEFSSTHPQVPSYAWLSPAA